MPPTDIDAYVAGLPPVAADAVATVRALVHRVVPDAEEAISYGIPTFRRDGRAFVHVGAYTSYASTYPVPEPGDDAELDAALAPHRAGKGTLRFRYADGLPLDLLERVVALLAEQRAPRTPA